MDIKTTVNEGVVIIQPQDDIDMHSSPSLREALQLHYKEETKAILADLSKVKYMDSSGIATFVECLQWQKANNKVFVIFSMAENIRGVFEMAKLDTIFTIVASEKDAQKHVA